MKKLPFCSIIVLNYNGRRFLKDCFNSLGKINYPKNKYEVIMIDNASVDDSVNFVKKKFPWVKILKLDNNYGSGGNNKGIEKAKGKYLIMLNNDTRVDKNWLIELVKVVNRNKEIGICGSRIIASNGRISGEGYLNMLGVPIPISNQEIKECFWVCDCSMLIKREVVDKMKTVYDPSFFMYFEEVDVCWRARLLGYKVFHVPDSIVFHKEKGASSKEGNIMDFYHYRNKIWTFKKNSRFPLTQLFMIPIFVTTFFTMLNWIFTKKWDYGIYVLKYIFSKIEKTSGLNRISLKDQLKFFYIHS